MQDVLAVQRDAEVRVQRQQRVRDAREQRREAQRFCAEGREGAVRDDPVRVVPEDVLACRWQLGCAVQTRGKVGCEQRPDLLSS